MTEEMGIRVLASPEAVSNAKDLAVLAIIALHADEFGEVLFTWKELSDRTRVPRSSLAGTLNRLEDAGLLTRRQWRSGRSNGATHYTLSGDLWTHPHSKSDASHVSPKTGISKQESVRLAHSRVPGDSVVVDDPLSGDGLRRLLAEVVEAGWEGPAAVSLAQAARLEAQTRLGRLARGRSHVSFEEAMDDLTSRVWEVLRTETEKVLEADNPWGLVAVIVERHVCRADGGLYSETPWDHTSREDQSFETDYEHGVTSVSVTDVLEDFGSAHQMFVHRLVEFGVPQGVAWSGTRRVLEIATSTGVNDRITRARADGALSLLGISEKAAGAWMGLIAGTRRGGPESSFVLRVSRGGVGVTEDEARRFSVVAREVAAGRSPTH